MKSPKTLIQMPKQWKVLLCPIVSPLNNGQPKPSLVSSMPVRKAFQLLQSEVVCSSIKSSNLVLSIPVVVEHSVPGRAPH